MLTKTKKIRQEKNDLETNHSFPIPKNIQEKINERGFVLYNWIGENDFKNSLKNDFFYILNSIGTFFGIVIITYGIIYFYSGGLIEKFGFQHYSYLPNLIYIIILLMFLIIIMGYISFKSIQKSIIFLKNHYILLTNTHILLNGKISFINDYNSFINDTNKIGKQFNEKIFKNSQLSKQNDSSIKEMKKKISNGYKYITKSLKNESGEKSSGIIGIIILIFYTGYVYLIWIIYYIGIFLVTLIGLFLSFINKQILLITGHKIIIINNHFENIDKYSKELVQEKNKLSTLLKDAMKNDWKDSLLLKINDGIKNINKNIELAVNTSIELKKDIESSKYKEMFNFNIYNSWIKKQIIIPLKQIKDLLNSNLIKLQETLKQITNQIKETTDNSLSGPLTSNKLRIEKKIIDIEEHIKAMDVYINKIK